MSVNGLSRIWTQLSDRRDNDQIVRELIGSYRLDLETATDEAVHDITRQALIQLKILFDHQLLHFVDLDAANSLPATIIQRELCFKAILFILSLGSGVRPIGHHSGGPSDTFDGENEQCSVKIIRNLTVHAFMSAFRNLCLHPDPISSREEEILRLRVLTVYKVWQTWEEHGEPSGLERLVLLQVVPDTLERLQSHDAGRPVKGFLATGSYEQRYSVQRSPFCSNPSAPQERVASINACKHIVQELLDNLGDESVFENFWVLYDTRWCLETLLVRQKDALRNETTRGALFGLHESIPRDQDDDLVATFCDLLSETTERLCSRAPLVIPLSLDSDWEKQVIFSDVENMENAIFGRELCLRHQFGTGSNGSFSTGSRTPMRGSASVRRESVSSNIQPLPRVFEEPARTQTAVYGNGRRQSTVSGSRQSPVQPEEPISPSSMSNGPPFNPYLAAQIGGDRHDSGPIRSPAGASPRNLVGSEDFRYEFPSNGDTDSLFLGGIEPQGLIEARSIRSYYVPSNNPFPGGQNGISDSDISIPRGSSRVSLTGQSNGGPGSPSPSTTNISRNSQQSVGGGQAQRLRAQPSSQSVQATGIDPGPSPPTRRPTLPDAPVTPPGYAISDPEPTEPETEIDRTSPGQSKRSLNGDAVSTFSKIKTSIFGLPSRGRTGSKLISSTTSQPPISANLPDHLSFCFSATGQRILFWDRGSEKIVTLDWNNISNPTVMFRSGRKLHLRSNNTTEILGRLGICLVQGGNEVVAVTLHDTTISRNQQPGYKLVCFKQDSRLEVNLSSSNSTPIALAVSRDDRVVAVGFERKVVLYSVGTALEEIVSFPAHSKYKSDHSTGDTRIRQTLSFSLDSTLLVVATQEPIPRDEESERTTNTRQPGTHAVYVRVWSCGRYTSPDEPPRSLLNIGHDSYEGLSGAFHSTDGVNSQVFLTAKTGTKSYYSILPITGTTARQAVKRFNIDAVAQGRSGGQYIFKCDRTLYVMPDITNPAILHEVSKLPTEIQKLQIAVGFPKERIALALWREGKEKLVLQRIDLTATGELEGKKSISLEEAYHAVLA
ncbi:hypothetical protein OQA88_11004 [Cercophora sp. LCS_1]